MENNLALDCPVNNEGVAVLWKGSSIELPANRLKLALCAGDIPIGIGVGVALAVWLNSPCKNSSKLT